MPKIAFCEKSPIQTIHFYYTIYKEKTQEKTRRFADFYLFFTKPAFFLFLRKKKYLTSAASCIIILYNEKNGLPLKEKGMAENKGKKIRFIYGIGLAALTVIVGALFILQVCSIYSSSPESPYTVESISAHFNQIAIPVWLWVAAVVGNIVLSFVFPEEEEAPKAEVGIEVKLNRLRKRLPENAVGVSAINAKRRSRVWAAIACGAFVAAAIALCLFHLLNENYTPMIGEDFFPGGRALADRLVRSVPWIIDGFLLCIVVTEFFEKSQEEELALTKTAIAESAKQGIKATAGKTQEKKGFFRAIGAFFESEQVTSVLRILFAVAGIALVVVGIFNGGMHDMLQKAINICTQCIGLG